MLSVRQLWDSWAKVEKIYYICRKFAKANLLIALSLVPIVRHRVLLFYQIRHILGTHLKENPSQNALRGVFCGVTGNRTRDTRIFSPLLYQLSYDTNFVLELPFLSIGIAKVGNFSEVANFSANIFQK